MHEDQLTELKDGLSRSERLLRQLLPANVEIDGRDASALMQLAANLSGQFNYYNAENRIEGDWQDFFLSNVNMLTLLISGLDLSSLSKTYESLRSAIWFSATEEALQTNFRLLLDSVFGLANRLGGFLEKTDNIHMPADIGAKMATIRASVADIRAQLPAAPPAASASGGLAMDASREKILPILPVIHTAYTNLLMQYNQLKDVSDYYRKNNEWSGQQYAPHLGLFITFLQLYSHLREQINQLTKKHLDFYYRDILGIDSGTEIPDKVHLLLALDTNAEYVPLQIGEEMPAEIPGWDEPLKYRLTTDIAVTKTKIAALRTLFISNNPVFMGNDPALDLLRNAQLYKGDYPCIPPDLLLKGTTPSPWPLFGEDQEELARHQRTMTDAAIGLLLASPIFYLTEGSRRIQLTFYFEPASFKPLSNYIAQFAATSLKTLQGAQNELLTHAFKIDFTAADGWSPAERYTVRMPEDNTLQVLIDLGFAAKPFVLYNPVIHGPDHGTDLPVLRLLVDQDASHNAFSFFRSLLIERIHIKSEVKYFRHIRMQNSIGNVAVASAFQPFGPQPVVGSYLDIKNSNIFNRYTTDLAVRLEWMELPREPGGFATWFEGYNTGVTDDSFRVGIGALTNGTSQPAVALQQSFPLYTESPDDPDGPASATWIKGIDIKKLGFINRPLLAKEEEEPDGFFRNGAIRLELLSPPQAFGHTLFPKIFPEIALHNARRWNKKLPLPNQPYTPKAKSATINYTLEHAEAFKDIRESGSAEGGLELIHQYPFGYRKIYPGNNLRFLSFLPCFDSGGHLHIGLSNVKANEELSLLFQLDEKNFHHTLHDTDKATWSYLLNDDWVEIGDKSILSDTTHGFISTGIVRLKMPAPIGLHNTTWPAGLCWIRASISGAADMKSRVIAILPHAAAAERVPDQTGKLPAAGFFLPPGSIKNFIHKVQGLSRVWQPFPSFGGKPAEKDEAYYVRISERLRHRKRPLTSLDIEQLVLEKFPSIAMVKCFGTSNQRQLVYPGVDMQVILIPGEGTDGGFYTDQPKVNLATLFAVKNYLAGFASPFINIEIGNPVYEKVKIACRIRLADHADTGYYLKQLHEDIQQYLCPWIYSPGSAIKIGTRIYIPEILTFIKRRSYITEVTGFSVVHFFNIKDPITGELKGAMIDSAVDAVEFIQGSVPEAVLIPSDHHLIGLLEGDDYTEPSPKGIGDFYIGDELLVSYPRHADREGYDEEAASREDPDEYFNLTINNPIN